MFRWATRNGQTDLSCASTGDPLWRVFAAYFCWVFAVAAVKGSWVGLMLVIKRLSWQQRVKRKVTKRERKRDVLQVSENVC